MIEGKIEQINLSLYPISEQVIFGSRGTIFDVHCKNAADALHVYVADKSNCNYFITADIVLANVLKNSNLGYKLVTVDFTNTNDMSAFFSNFEP
jgi:predicted nucleic acid-binding protein